MDSSLPGSSVYGILQARILEWVAILFSRDLPDLEIKPRSPALQPYSLPSEPQGKPKDSFKKILLKKVLSQRVVLQMVLITHPSCAISDLILLRKLHFFFFFFWYVCVYEWDHKGLCLRKLLILLAVYYCGFSHQ